MPPIRWQNYNNILIPPNILAIISPIHIQTSYPVYDYGNTLLLHKIFFAIVYVVHLIPFLLSEYKGTKFPAQIDMNGKKSVVKDCKNVDDDGKL